MTNRARTMIAVAGSREQLSPGGAWYWIACITKVQLNGQPCKVRMRASLSPVACGGFVKSSGQAGKSTRLSLRRPLAMLEGTP